MPATLNAARDSNPSLTDAVLTALSLSGRATAYTTSAATWIALPERAPERDALVAAGAQWSRKRAEWYLDLQRVSLAQLAGSRGGALAAVNASPAPVVDRTEHWRSQLRRPVLVAAPVAVQAAPVAALPACPLAEPVAVAPAPVEPVNVFSIARPGRRHAAARKAALPVAQDAEPVREVVVGLSDLERRAQADVREVVEILGGPWTPEAVAELAPRFECAARLNLAIHGQLGENHAARCATMERDADNAYAQELRHAVRSEASEHTLVHPDGLDSKAGKAWERVSKLLTRCRIPFAVAAA